MATINLGAIKFNWKGAYNSSTTYAVDDVVSSGGNSYVCIQAHSNQAVGNATAYWNIMSSAGTNGTNGTNVATTITTQGDLLYRDGSGLQRLGAGTSGQVLQTGVSGANPSWTTVAGGAFSQVQYRQISSSSFTNSNTSNYVSATSHYVDITPSTNANTKKILVNLNPRVVFNRDSTDVALQYQITRTVGGSSTVIQESSSVQAYSNTNGSTNFRLPVAIWYQDTPQTTSAVRYSFNFRNPHGGSIIEVGGGSNVFSTYIAYELN